MKQHLAHDWYSEPVPDNVWIGERSWVYSSFAFLHCQSRRPVGVRIGDDTGVYHGSFFELGHDGEVEIGNFCTLVGAIIATNQRVVIHDYAFIAHEVTIADTSVAAPPRAVDSVQTDTTPRVAVEIGENVWIGARAVLLDGARIGKNAIVGAASVVDFEVPDNSIIAGNPASVVGHVLRTRNSKSP